MLNLKLLTKAEAGLSEQPTKRLSIIVTIWARFVLENKTLSASVQIYINTYLNKKNNTKHKMCNESMKGGKEKLYLDIN